MRTLTTALTMWHAMVCVLAVVLGILILLHTKGVAPPRSPGSISIFGGATLAVALASLCGLDAARAGRSLRPLGRALLVLPFVAVVASGTSAFPVYFLPGAVLAFLPSRR